MIRPVVNKISAMMSREKNDSASTSAGKDQSLVPSSSNKDGDKVNINIHESATNTPPPRYSFAPDPGKMNYNEKLTMIQAIVELEIWVGEDKDIPISDFFKNHARIFDARVGPMGLCVLAEACKMTVLEKHGFENLGKIQPVPRRTYHRLQFKGSYSLCVHSDKNLYYKEGGDSVTQVLNTRDNKKYIRLNYMIGKTNKTVGDPTVTHIELSEFHYLLLSTLIIDVPTAPEPESEFVVT